MEKEIVKSVVGRLGGSVGEFIGIFEFICEGLYSRTVHFGARILVDLYNHLTELYDGTGDLKINPEPATAKRLLEFESLGERSNGFPSRGELTCIKFQLHRDMGALGILMSESGGDSVLFAFDHYALGEFRSQLEQYSWYVVRAQ